MHLTYADLCLRYDGAIPEHLLRAARLAEFSTRRLRFRVRLRVKHWTPAGQVDRLASAMTLIRARDGAATTQALLIAGFTQAELDRYGEAARALAASRWDRRL